MLTLILILLNLILIYLIVKNLSREKEYQKINKNQSKIIRHEIKKDLHTIKNIATNDYYSSRGYYHLNLINKNLPILEEKIRVIEKNLNKKLSILKSYEYQMEKDIKYNAYYYLIKRDLPKYPGLNRKIVESILKNVFDGDIKSLYRCDSLLKGIGAKKQEQINLFISYALSINPMEINFPNRELISSKYKNLIENLNFEIKNLSLKISELKEIRENAIKNKILLENVKIEDFLNILENKNFDYNKINNFINGVFSEREEMPTWFKKLINIEEYEPE